jgi:hypothetical protein
MRREGGFVTALTADSDRFESAVIRVLSRAELSGCGIARRSLLLTHPTL